jgi:hypothetical protein
MERSLVTVERVRDLQAGGKRWLEEVLGQQLQENQQVFIMVLSPGSEPDEAARRQAHTGLDATFQKTSYSRSARTPSPRNRGELS